MRTNARGDVDGASGLEPATTARDRRLTVARRAAITAWALALVYRTLTNGFAVQPELLLLYIVTGLTAASIGRHHKVLLVVRDWLPFALVLVLYDFSRGAARLVGRPTLWQLQPEVDRWLCFGAVPTVWLQERLKMPEPSWWEVIISTVFMSYFIVPYAVAGWLWMRNRDDWKAFILRFLTLSFAAVVIYIVVPGHRGPLPTAPPTISPVAPPLPGACSTRQTFPATDCSAPCTPAMPGPTILWSGSPPAAGQPKDA